uniref:Uncharacterized protein n=1 Tax=Hanusia phi TaxID=3032 RepID=A0A6T7LX05_9CRYP|mmetsp:Transcript_10926/g.24806  ORF Transcript_10926/g.24806 Transcript_10926/m.24806 type:complete len:533 (+) Transcript_10926:623-2221(+)
MDINCENFEHKKVSSLKEEGVNQIILISENLKSSYGPLSHDKMILNEYGDLTITNDGATIFKSIKFSNPLIKIFSDLSLQQDREIGDGTTGVVIFCSELLKKALNLIKKKIHPSTIIFSYRLALCYSLSQVKTLLSKSFIEINLSKIIQISKTSLAGKICNLSISKFSLICYQAVKSISVFDKDSNRIKCQKNLVTFLKIQGDSTYRTRLVDGICITDQTAAWDYEEKIISPGRIFCLSRDLQFPKIDLNYKFIFKKIEKIKDISKSSSKFFSGLIEKLLIYNSNFLITNKNIDNNLANLLKKNGIISLKRVSDEDFKKICIFTGCKLKVNLNILEDNSQYCMGKSEEIFEQLISNRIILTIRGCRFCCGNTILIRGPSNYMLDELSRGLWDSICIIKKSFEGNNFVIGGGSLEIFLSILLDKFSNLLKSKEELSVLEFSNSLLEIPKILFRNSRLDEINLINKIKTIYNVSLRTKNSSFKDIGVNLKTGFLQNNFEKGIIEPRTSKLKAFQIATEVVISLLRIDDIIVNKL